ncbi:MAG: aspartate--tRNA ligase [Flavobacteriales bacterium]|nr:aspartate--tRNA ligase [Flavobacteriales bacterium]|tara:strand:- start:769 stop:2541 length:1773 start_codon:yes stop_codon:yes gene_type:complete
MYRTVNNGELRKEHIGKNVLMCGWVQKSRDLGGMTFVDIRDRYGITQLVFNMDNNASLCESARQLGREDVIQIYGKVIARASVNKQILTGDIEVEVEKLTILNKSKTPPFTIEDSTDGGDELRMEYRYLDIRRNPIKNNILLRAKISSETRKYLDGAGFCEVETPYLIKSTPEGARDFIVPSRMNKNQFYALPQSPQTFKQLLMVGGIDKYYQIVKCFRDEDLRADRQPEFTQIDCEMAFVEQEDILNMFEGLIVHLLKTIKGIKLSKFPRITYEEAIKRYGTDKPDIRFDMEFVELTDLCKKNNFIVFDNAELVVGFNIKDGASFSRKEIDKLIDFSKTPQVGAKGLVYCKYNYDETIKSSVDKFFSKNDLTKWVTKCNSSPGDLILIMAGETKDVRKSLSMLRLHIAEKIGLRDPKVFAPLWVLDFPLLEWDEESQRYHAMHHPFTAPKPDDVKKLHSDPGLVKANAYDLVINGNEIGGGSIRIHNKNLQSQMFKHLGFTDKEAKEQFGFLMNAFEYGAPPHGGVAFGFDRLCAIMGGSESIRDFIAFPKNNSGRDIMLDAPSKINNEQLDELGLKKIDQNDSSRNTN